MCERSGKRTLYWIMLSFATKGRAKLARDRILEEQNGGDWPPFAVAFASPSNALLWERPAEDSTPGAPV